GSSSLIINRPSVDLPDPDSPTSPTVSPAKIWRLTCCTAFMVSARRANRPSEPAGNSLLRFSVRISGRAPAAALAARCNSAGAGELDPDTGDIMVWSLGFERRLDPRAVVDLERASRMEPASARRISRAGDRARYRLQARAFYSAGARNRRQQPARVRIERVAEQLGRVRLLHYARGVENRHIVGILGDHAEIVRYQDDRETEPLLEIADQVENLRLDRNVERGGRLVGDQQVGVARERHRDHHPLAHPAGQLMRVVVDPAFRIGDPDHLERLDRALACFVPRSLLM